MALAASLGGCSLATRAGVAFLYEKADLPTAQIVRDVCYTAAQPCDTPKHTLDRYRPAATGWPVIIFVHGGNWNSGDKNDRAGGANPNSCMPHWPRQAPAARCYPFPGKATRAWSWR